MKRGASTVAWVVLVMTAGLVCTSLPFVVTRGNSAPGVVPGSPFGILYGFNSIAFAVAAVLVARGQPRNRTWIAMCTIALSGATFGAVTEYTIQAAILRHDLPGEPVTAWIASWVFSLLPGGLAALLLIFPTGRLPSPRWRPALWLLAAALLVVVATSAVNPVFPQDTPGGRGGIIQNPLAVPRAFDPLLGAVGFAGYVLLGACFVLGVASLVVRYRTGATQERQQLKWFMFIAPFVPLAFLVYSATVTVQPGGRLSPLALLYLPLGLIATVGQPVALGLAIMKYRLYDIDIVINRTLVYGALAVFITAVYVAIVVGAGALIGTQGRPNLLLSIVATAVVALAVQPVRERLQRFSNRVVYGRRATPYQVLAQFSARVADTYGAEDVLPHMARLLGEATGAAQARVWMRSGNDMRVGATWPQDAAHLEPPTLPVVGMLPPSIPDVTSSTPIRHQGTLLGMLSVQRRGNESLTPVEQALMNDLAQQAGLVLRNVGLTTELLGRLDELRASRQRLVAAQDGERRRLERDLHDGAQQNLVALKLKLGLLEMTMEKDLAKARALVAQVKDDADETLNTLRDLARGIYPPLLAEQGLVAALESQSRKATLPVSVTAGEVGRYPQEVEAAIYFSCLEGLQNVQKYAGAASAELNIGEGNGHLRFEIRDDGVGFDMASVARGSGLQNIADRIDAIGGTLTVESTPGAGTRIGADIPIRVEERALTAVRL
ncbi:MAG: histidine kinase [Candidatus Dormibacteria bacterium]